MGTPSIGRPRLAFGLFEADLAAGELYRNGRRIPLQEKPFHILALLLERPGEVVTREEVSKQLWPDGTHVDFDEGLDTALRKLRYALGDSAKNPVFIETIPRRGYRFLAPVSNATPNGNQACKDSAPVPASGPGNGEVWTRKAALAVGGIVVLAVISYGVVRWVRRTRALEPRSVQMTRLTNNGQAQGVAISPDGRNVIYARGDDQHQSLWLEDIATSWETEILPLGTGFHGLTVSPDGAAIYFVRADENDPSFKYLYSMPLHGGQVRKLITDVDSPVSFSPDGNQFVYEHCAQPRDDIDVRIANADGSNDRILAVIHGGTGMLYQPGPNWSPDGRTIVVPVVMVKPALRQVLDIISTAEGKIRELYSNDQELGRPVWIAGGTALMFPRRDQATQRFQLWTVSFPDGRAQPLTHDLSDYGIDLDRTRDGRLFVTTATSINSQVWIASAPDLTRARQVTSDTLPLMQIAEAPDGKLLAGSHELSVWMMHSDGSYRIRFSDLQPADEPTSCGNFVVLRVIQSDSMALVRTDKDGSHPVALTRGNVYSPTCSGDKASIFYFTWNQPQMIWRVPVAGGAPERLANALGDQLNSQMALSPDGKFLAYAYTSFGRVPSKGVSIAVMLVGQNFPTKEFPFPGGAFSLRWSPDGKGLEYPVTQNGVSNLWEQPLSGGGPRQITKFADSQIFDFNWTADGRELLLTRGNESQDAILLSRLP
ncbi:MAG TPA: winged helix-turn-helix domain-containing protein [Candidatus Binatus sp.]|nr:winged helix-turn-helix domain-containing protein [Candidatus Binatus sp.]